MRVLGFFGLIAALALPALPVSAEGEGSPWGYSGDTGPDKWGAHYETCRSGQNQSPIDLVDGEAAEMNRIVVRYKVTPLSLENNGHTVKVNYRNGSLISVGEKDFYLTQIHFHTPSEHKLNGEAYSGEIHFVHQNDVGELAVIAVLIGGGDQNLAAEEIIAFLPAQAGETREEQGVLINGRDLMPDTLEYFRYMGSLTTPPCTEGVNWYVLKQPITMSMDQISRLTAAMGQNARPVQERHFRLLLDAASTR